MDVKVDLVLGYAGHFGFNEKFAARILHVGANSTRWGQRRDAEISEERTIEEASGHLKRREGAFALVSENGTR
jgi:hypothetical protein